ncbi:MAG: hypothetical protein AAFY70_17820 [Bacteroidota bacterium]
MSTQQTISPATLIASLQQTIQSQALLIDHQKQIIEQQNRRMQSLVGSPQALSLAETADLIQRMQQAKDLAESLQRYHNSLQEEMNYMKVELGHLLGLL